MTPGKSTLFRRLFLNSSIHGFARNIRWSMDSAEYVLTFQIERQDQESNTLEYIPVVLRGQSITGKIVEGDEMEIMGKLTRKGMIQPKRIRNLSVNQDVVASSLFRGIVRNVQWRTEQKGSTSYQYQVLSFRIERIDHEGNVVDLISVEMMARSISGQVVNGDEVEVESYPFNAGILKPNRIHNLTTDEVVRKNTLF